MGWDQSKEEHLQRTLDQIKIEMAKKAKLEDDIREQQLRVAKKLQDRAPFSQKGA